MNNITQLSEANVLIARLVDKREELYETLYAHKVPVNKKTYETPQSLAGACYTAKLLDADIEAAQSLVERYCFSETVQLYKINCVAAKYKMDIPRKYPLFVGYNLWNQKGNLAHTLANAKRSKVIYHTEKGKNIKVALKYASTEEKLCKYISESLLDEDTESFYTERSADEIRKAAAIIECTFLPYTSDADHRAGVMGVLKTEQFSVNVLCPPRNCFTLLGDDKIVTVSR